MTDTKRDNRELKEVLKEASRAAWRKIKKIGLYATVAAVTLVGMPRDKVKDEMRHDSMQAKERFDEFAKQLRDSILINSPEKRLEKLPRTQDGCVEMSTLLENEVTLADIKAVLEKNPENVAKIQAGKKSKKLASEAEKKTGQMKGNCLLGLQQIFGQANIGIQLDGTNRCWNSYPMPQSKNDNKRYHAACYVGDVLEDSGGFIKLSYKNNRDNNNKLLENSPMGTVFTWDNIDVKGANAGARFGHVGVLCQGKGKRRIAADGVQYVNADRVDSYCHRYGNCVSVTFSTDCTLDESLCLEILQESALRKQREAEQSNGAKEQPKSINVGNAKALSYYSAISGQRGR